MSTHNHGAITLIQSTPCYHTDSKWAHDKLQSQSHA